MCFFSDVSQYFENSLDLAFSDNLVRHGNTTRRRANTNMTMIQVDEKMENSCHSKKYILYIYSFHIYIIYMQ